MFVFRKIFVYEIIFSTTVKGTKNLLKHVFSTCYLNLYRVFKKKYGLTRGGKRGLKISM